MTGLARRPRPVDAGAARATASTAGAAPTTATPPSPASPPSRRCRPPAAPTPAASCSSRPARRAAAPTCRPTSRPSADRLGTPSLVVCLDSGCVDYERLWITTSLRGLVGGDAHRRGPRRGRPLGQRQRRRARHVPHRPPAARPGRGRRHRRGAAGRAVPRRPSPTIAADEAAATAADPGDAVTHEFPLGRRRPSRRSTTRPSSSSTGRGGRRSAVIGADGLPATDQAGNVLRPSTTLQLSFRLPPTCDPRRRRRRCCARRSPPTRPTAPACRFDGGRRAGPGGTPRRPRRGCAPRSSEASQRQRSARRPARFGEGGSIPFMGMLGDRFPEAQFVVTGVLGPDIERPRPQRVPPPADRRAPHRLPGRRPRRHAHR